MAPGEGNAMRRLLRFEWTARRLVIERTAKNLERCAQPTVLLVISSRCATPSVIYKFSGKGRYHIY